MTRQSRLLRMLLVLLLGALVLGCGFLYLASLESAQNWPTLAYLRMPVYVGTIVGAIPIVLAIAVTFNLLKLVDRGLVFTDSAVEFLQRLRLLTGIFAGYVLLWLVGFWGLTGLMHATILLGWFAVELAALFIFTTLSLLTQLLASAVKLRNDNEMTV